MIKNTNKQNKAKYSNYIFDEHNNLIDNLMSDPSEYVPRIEGTELIWGITIGSFNYFPILTCRIKNNKRNFYLFDFIKVWITR